jgi:glutamate dehydrogenase
VPRDRYNTENRERVGRILLEAFGGKELDWTVQRSESVLARVHYIVRCADGLADDYDVGAIEARLVQATRAWTDDLREALVDELGEEQGLRLYRRYERAFPAGYRADWSARAAVSDICRLDELRTGAEPIINLYRPLEAQGATVRCKLFSVEPILLSDVLPTFEHMGAKVVDERPYAVDAADGRQSWIYDIGLRCIAHDLDQVREIFQAAFLGVWRGEFEDDRLNGLVLHASLTGRQVTIIRAIAKYLRQAGTAFSNAYIQRTLLRHPTIAVLLVRLFIARFDPDVADPEAAQEVGAQVETAINDVQSLDEDRILRSFLIVIRAMTRTNYFVVGEDGADRAFLSFKLDPTLIPLLPLPRPRFEIFVYAPRFEGVHLRGGKGARGGIRWSDRPEDFRTEILGLAKAQMVKNALIVPVGAKGGFALKRAPEQRGREAVSEEAVACFRMFLAGLLDLTDNIVDGSVRAPDRVRRYDDDDPYLVVAADKGTATFSDIANEVSSEYGFWLGDAFASGGSHGYDHKKMGITARGVWESVKRHFRELGRDIETRDFTVVGIGDMSGDVFGNGMLCSRHIKLVGAFNHLHVFLDPDPDGETSYQERERLFELPRSAWTDYDESVISEGGGVYSRTAKSIPIPPRAREVLGIDEQELSGADLIQAMLRAPVDLLFNGGIGTNVKSSTETQADAGDKANDNVRVDGRDVRARVVGEGGNLGFTQPGRIEYALSGGPEGGGGQIYTDAIDNVAGVNTSDHEVNIKILLDSLISEGEMTAEQRNELLFEMQDAVADRVLYACYTQAQAISLALAQAAPMIDIHGRLMRYLEHSAALNRELEFLPGEDVIAERKGAHRGLVAPELAVLMAYCKIDLHSKLLASDLPDDRDLLDDLERYFPWPLPERYGRQMRNHRLRRDIIATVVADQLVDRAGTTFVFRQGEESGAPPSMVARAYTASREILDMRSFWSSVEALDNDVRSQTQLEMLIEGRRLVERSTRWLVLERPGGIKIEEEVKRFEPGAELLSGALPEILDGAEAEAFDEQVSELTEAGVPGELARRVAAMPSLLPVFDIVAVAEESGRAPEEVMETYFRLASRLELAWLRDRIYDLPRSNRWQALARAALRDDLMRAHRELTREVLDFASDGHGGEEAIDEWAEGRPESLERSLNTLADIRASRTYDTTTLPVALREVRSLIRGGEGEPSGTNGHS